jgi:hypothetical protein
MEEGAAASMVGEKRVAVDVPADATAGNGHAAGEKVVGDLPAPAALSGWPRRTGLYLFVMNIRCISSCSCFLHLAPTDETLSDLF